MSVWSLTEEQQQYLQSILESYVPVENRNLYNAYAYIDMLLTTQEIIDGMPRPGTAPVDQSIEVLKAQLWFAGATMANKGEGAFSTLIREFTYRQGALRGINIDLKLMNAASDQVAISAITDALGTKINDGDGIGVPSLQIIAENDATAVGTTIFSQLTDLSDTAYANNSAWAGTLLFSMMGEDQTWRLLGSSRDEATFENINDLRDVLFAIDSFIEAVKMISVEDLTDGFFSQMATLWGLIGIGTVDASDLIDLFTGDERDLLRIITDGQIAGDVINYVSGSDYGFSHYRFVDALGDLFKLPVSGTNSNTFLDNAKTLFDALKEDGKLNYGIIRIDKLSIEELVGQALVDPMYTYALDHLNPFVITGDSGLYSEIDPADFSEEYLLDRARMLDLQNHRSDSSIDGRESTYKNSDDLYTGHIARYIDQDTGMDVTVKPKLFSDPEIIEFGTKYNDLLSGLSKNDHLYGRDGDDTLIGKKGDDYLEGGKGIDTYIFNDGDGNDIIVDTGENIIIVNGNHITHFLDNGDGTYSLPGTNIKATHNSPLTITDSTGSGVSVVIENWQAGDFGIELIQKTSSANSQVATFGSADNTVVIEGRKIIIPGESTETRTSAIDTVYAGDGNDYVSVDYASYNPNIHVYGGNGDDALTVYYKEARVEGAKGVYFEGNAGNDTLVGSNNDDWLDGGNDHDYLYSYEGEDILIGGKGNDLMLGGAHDDDLFGAEGDDWLFGGAQSDNIQGGSGNDRIYGDTDRGSVTIVRDITSRTFAGWDGYNTIQYAAANWWAFPAEQSLVEMYNFQDVASDQAGNDILSGNDGDDAIFGGAGNDLIFGGNDNDYLNGEAGDDQIYGGSGNDIIFGDFNAKQYSADQDTVIFQDYDPTFNRTVLSYFRQYQDPVNTAGNDYLDGGDGNDLIFGGNGNDVLIGGAGRDQLEGGKGDDQYFFDGDWGIDIIVEESGTDTVRFGAGITPDDINVFSKGNHIILFDAKGNQVQLYNWKGSNHVESVVFLDGTVWDKDYLQNPKPQTILGTDGSDVLTGNDLDNYIAGFAGNDTLHGYAGNDWLDGGFGKDTYYGGTGNDYLGGGFQSQDYYGSGDLTSEGNTYVGGAGDDILFGTRHADRYIFNLGDGKDIISFARDQFATVTGRDVLEFGAGITADSLTATRSGLDLIIHVNENDQITVRNWFADTLLRFDATFSDGSTLTHQQLTALGGTTSGSADDDVIHGIDDPFNGDVINGYAGKDTLYGHGGQDTLDGGDGDDILDGGFEQDTLIGGAGNDTLGGDFMSEDYYGRNPTYASVPEQGNIYMGGKGDDLLRATRNTDRFIFNRGDGIDTITYTIDPYNSTKGARDTLELGPGIRPDNVQLSQFENDLVVRVSETDQVIIKDWFINSQVRLGIYFSEDGTTWDYNMVQQQAWTINGTAGDDVIYGNDSNYYNYIYGKDGNDTIYGSGELYGGAGNDVLSGYGTFDGGLGDDTLESRGANSVDTFLFGRGDGHDTIITSGTNGFNRDQIIFDADVTAANIQLSRSENDLVLTIKDTGDSLTIKNYLVDTNSQIRTFKFSDRTTLPRWTDIVASLTQINGTAGDDTLVGTDYFDAINGGDGNDTITGGKDADQLAGGLGNDTYIYSIGDGRDVITESDSTVGNLDRIQFTSEILPENVTLARSLTDLIVQINGTDDTITVKNWFSGNAAIVEQIVFNDGTVWDESFIRNTLLVTTDGDDIIDGLAGDDVIDGLEGNDTIYGNVGNDVLIGSQGDDRLYGGDGNDFLAGEDGLHNNLDGGRGDDIILGGDDVDVVTTSTEITTETINPGSGTNYIDAGRGNDRITISSQTEYIHNTFYYNIGDGFDEIYDGSEKFKDQYGTYQTISNTVVFGEGIAVEDLSVQAGVWEYWPGGRDFMVNLVISIGDGEGFIYTSDNDIYYAPGLGILEGNFDGTISQEDMFVGEFRFADGTVLTGEDILALADGGHPAPLDWYGPINQANIVGSNVDDVIIGSVDGNDTMDHVVKLRDGNDYLSDFYGRLVVDAGAGYDEVETGYNGNGIVAGGKDDDTVRVYGNNNTVLFNRTDGHDYVSTYTGATDTLSLGGGIQLGDIQVYRGTGDNTHQLTFVFNDNGSAITINWYGHPSNPSVPDEKIKYLQLTDEQGTRIFDLQTLVDSLETQLASTDVSSALQLFTAENIAAYERTGTVAAKGGAYAQAYALTGDMFATLGTNTNDVLNGTDGRDTLGGKAGNDTLIGGNERDTLIGGTGDDLLQGGSASDYYVYNLGDGHDTIDDNQGLRDRITFGANITEADVSIVQEGNDLLLTLSSNESIRVQNWYMGNTIEELAFEDGTLLNLAQIEARIGLTPRINTAPVLETRIQNQDALIDNAFAFNLPANTFVEMDAGDSYTLTATLWDGSALPDWLSFDAMSGMFSGTPTSSDAGALYIKVTATDTLAATTSDHFLVVVGNNQVNTVPVVNTPIGDQNILEDEVFNFQIPANAIIDVDGDVLTYSATLADGNALPGWLSFDSNTHTFTGNPANEEVGALSLRVTASDPQGQSVDSVFTLTVVNVNDAPTVSTPIGNQITDEDALFTYQIPVGTFSDVDAGDSLVLAATLADGAVLPSWLAFDSATGTFSGTPGNEDVGSLAVTVTATDMEGATAQSTFDITINNVNDAPVVSMSIDNQITDEDAVFNFQIPQGTFTDVDANDTLTFAATLADGSALPSWLSFDAMTGTFTGTPSNDDVGMLSLLVTASDSAGESAQTGFDLTIINVNDAPVVNVVIADQNVDEYSPFTLTLGSDVFSDVDVGDSLTLTVLMADGSSLPSWLTFDVATLTFTGEPDHTAVGTWNLQVVATDLDGASVSNPFTLTVDSVGNAVVGTNSSEPLNGTEGNDVLFGGAGNDVMTSNGGDDILDGGDGNDVMTGGAGNDRLYGGAGNDLLIGTVGNDTYYFGRGDGQDIINDNDGTAGNEDRVVLDVDPLSLIFAKSGQDLMVKLANSTDSIIIQRWYSGNGRNQTEIFESSNGTVLHNGEVDQLIQAMAQFTTDTGISWEDAVKNQPDAVNQILAVYWDAA